jgi:hypothetical protein
MSDNILLYIQSQVALLTTVISIGSSETENLVSSMLRSTSMGAAAWGEGEPLIAMPKPSLSLVNHNSIIISEVI